MRSEVLLFILLLPALGCAQILSGDSIADPVLPADRHLPMGIRSAGMGGAGVAIAEDYSSLFYNPANLAYISRFEAAGALQFDILNYKGTLDGDASSEGSDNYIKLQSVGGVIPVPTSRGGLVFGIGFARTNTFDRRIRFKGVGDDGLIYDGDESVKGGLGKFCIGGGIQVSPYAALGMSLDFYAGGERYSWYYDRVNPGGTDWPDTVERKTILDDIRDEYSGIGARFGTLIVPNRFVQIGAYISTPTLINIDEEGVLRFDSLTTGWEVYQEDYDYIESIELTLPWRFGAGLAIRPTDWLVFAGDAEYVDWRQIEYDEPAWMLYQNRLMDDDFRPTLRWSAGGEVTIPVAAIRLRGGFSQEPIPYQVQGGDRVRNTISGGAGFILGDLVSLDMATQFSNWNADGERLDEEYRLARIWLGLSYRF
ncbi:hypothetical protein DRQ36_01160 [bacterium]|nr:MAG: hypothetical protein DRQ36_01160 [bacterium]